MAEVSERIELLINRHLDQVITPQEQAELDEALRDSMEARSMLADYERIDGWAVEVLNAARVRDTVLSPRPIRLAGANSLGLLTRICYVSGALAACLALVIWWSRPGPSPVASGGGRSGANASLPGKLPGVQTGSQPGGIIPASHQTGFEDHALDRDAIWYVADNGQIYLIERQIAQVSKRSTAESQVWLAAGGI